MRLNICAFLLATSLGFVNVATACPIDLAPCEEIVRPVDLSLDQQIDRIILASRAFDAELDIPSSVSVLSQMNDLPQQLVHLNHEDDLLVPPDYRVTADVTSQDDLAPDEIDPLPLSTELGEVVPARRFLLNDEDVIDVEHTGSVQTALATPDNDQGQWAQDGYEDR